MSRPSLWDVFFHTKATAITALVSAFVLSLWSMGKRQELEAKIEKAEVRIGQAEAALVEHLKNHNIKQIYLEQSYTCWSSCEGELGEVGTTKVCRCRNQNYLAPH